MIWLLLLLFARNASAQEERVVRLRKGHEYEFEAQIENHARLSAADLAEATERLGRSRGRQRFRIDPKTGIASWYRTKMDDEFEGIPVPQTTEFVLRSGRVFRWILRNVWDVTPNV